MPARPHQHLIEREVELDALRELVDGAVAGRGGLLVVEGSAGVGKSALVSSARVYANAVGLRVLGARGGELERDFAFGALRQLFEPTVTAASYRERERLFADAAAPAARALAQSRSDEPGAHGESGFAIAHAIYWLATNLTVDAPLLISVDDLHWVDEPSLRSLAYLARRVGDLPIALIVALRTSEPDAPTMLLDALQLDQDAARLSPRALSPAAVAETVRAQLVGAGDELCSALHAVSAGNPFYLRELLRAIAAGGLDGEPALSAKMVEGPAPSLSERIVRRIARVAPAAGALAAAMAVLGDGGSLQIAAVLSGLEVSEAAAVAHRLRRMEILSSDDPFAFVHPVVRRSVYDELSATERNAAHRDAARLLAESGARPEAIAAHLRLLPAAGSAAVATTLHEVAADALARAAPEVAVGLLSRALEEQADLPPRALLLFELGRAQMLLGDLAAIDTLQIALSLADDVDLRTMIVTALVELLGAAGQSEAATALIASAGREFGERDPELIVGLEAIRAVTMVYDRRQVAQFDRERRRLTRLTELDCLAAHALAALLAAVAANRCEGSQQVMSMARLALADERLLEPNSAGGWAYVQLLTALVGIDEYDEALELAERIGANSRSSGSLHGLLTGIGYRGFISARRGDLAAAEEDLRTALEVSAVSETPLWLATAFHLFQDAILERPSLDDVAARSEIWELAPPLLQTAPGAMLLEVRGRLRLARENCAGGLDDLRACADTWDALRIGPTFSSWRSALALALPAQERGSAIELVAEELVLARASGLARPEGVALRAAGILEGGKSGIDRLRESASCLARSEARLEQARSLIELGAALRRSHQRTSAREQLYVGLDMAHRCGAQRLATRAQEELLATGARPRRLVLSGVDALTISEQRVARLAAQGYSNTEVAQALYVSLKTVETHLSHAYEKLGLGGQGSRRRLEQALGS